MKAIGIAAAFLVAGVGPAQAEDWRLAAIATDKIRGVDTDSFRSEGHLRNYWIISVKDRPSIPGESYELVHEETDCLQRSFVVLAVVVYNSEGRSIRNWEGRSRAVSIIPGTFGENQFEAVCSQTWLDNPPGVTTDIFRLVARGVLDRR